MLQDMMKPRVTLTSLPHEVLTSIGSYLDATSLIELSRVTPSFTSLADDRVIWRHLPLYLPRYYGLSPAVKSSFADENTASRLEAQTSRLSDQHGAALLAKVKEIIMRATPERWSMVRKVTMRPRRGVLHPMLLVLDYVSPYVRRLTIEGATPHPMQSEGSSRTFESADFDVRSPFAYTTFSSLTHLHITSIASRYGNFYRGLVISSPCLTILEVEFDSDVRIPMNAAAEGAEDWEYEPHRLTRIRQIRFTWMLGAREKDRLAVRIASGILKHSLEVQQVNLNFGPTTPEPGVDPLMAAVSDPRRLQDLRWPYPVVSDFEFPELRRFVLRGDKWCDALECFEPMEKLEILYLDSFTPVSDQRFSTSSDYPDPFPSAESFPLLAAILRIHPLLHTIHSLPATTNMDDIALFDQLDGMEGSGMVIPNVFSMYHGEDEGGDRDELIQITFSRYFERVARRVPSGDLALYQSSEYVCLPSEYRSEGHPARLALKVCQYNVFRRLPQPIICIRADYQGLAVPPEIVKEMRDVEGGDRNWQQRGVEVGDEAWAVLQKWYSDITAEVGPAS